MSSSSARSWANRRPWRSTSGAIRDSLTGFDSDLFGHVLVLAPLSLLKGLREVAVVLGPAEIRQLTKTQTDNAIGQRIAEIDVFAVGHG